MKKTYIEPQITICLVGTENVMGQTISTYNTDTDPTITIGEDDGETPAAAKRFDSFDAWGEQAWGDD